MKRLRRRCCTRGGLPRSTDGYQTPRIENRCFIAGLMSCSAGPTSIASRIRSATSKAVSGVMVDPLDGGGAAAMLGSTRSIPAEVG